MSHRELKPILKHMALYGSELRGEKERLKEYQKICRETEKEIKKLESKLKSLKRKSQKKQNKAG